MGNQHSGHCLSNPGNSGGLLTALASQIKGNSVLIQVKNRAAVSYIQQQGETHSSSLLREMEPIIQAERNLKDLRAVYFSGHLNKRANHLSRRLLDTNKSSLHPKIFHWIVNQWGLPKLDHFATASNTKLWKFISCLPQPRSHRCPIKPLAVQSSLCISPRAHLEISLETCNGNNNRDSSFAVLAHSFLWQQSFVLRPSPPSESSQIEPSRLDIERQRFQSLGCSLKVISTQLHGSPQQTVCMIKSEKGLDLLLLAKASILICPLPPNSLISYKRAWTQVIFLSRVELRTVCGFISKASSFDTSEYWALPAFSNSNVQHAVTYCKKKNVCVWLVHVWCWFPVIFTGYACRPV